MGFFKKKRKMDFFYIAVDKIKNGIIKIKDALTNFFSHVLKWMNEVIDTLALKLRKPILGVTHFLRKKGDKYQEITKNYYLEEEIGEWNEVTVTNDLAKENVPPEYLTLSEEFEINDTEKIAAEIILN